MNTQYIKIYLSAVTVFTIIDAIWLKIMNKAFYTPQIGHLLSDSPNMAAAGIFYLFYVLALCILVVIPQVKSKAPLWQLFSLGALIGFMAYGTFDFTCLALFKNYPIIVVVVDVIWGGLVTGCVAVTVGALSYRRNWLS